MTEVERKTIKSALLKCAKEQENRPVYTGEVMPSLICKSAAERIEELEAQVKKMKCCQNCNNCMLTEYGQLECVNEREINTYPCDIWELC